MNSIVGCTIFTDITESRTQAILSAHEQALAYYVHMERQSFMLGQTHLELWGHKGMGERVHIFSDGSLVVVIGSPHGPVNIKDIVNRLFSDNFEIPWDGRVILLHVSFDGKCWTMWNDWLGSIPVFYAEIGEGRIASTLEPVTVAAAEYTPDDFFMPGLVSLLINGHFISDWTLYKGMKIIPPDCRMEWDEKGFRTKTFWTVQPSQSRWETGWDDLVDEMHELSHQAIANVLKTQSTWILPLSGGLDSRLIAGVGADIGVNLNTYAWGEPQSTDVVYSRQVAHKLGYPWKHINLPKDFLSKYTRQWARMFGSSMHFHGMYLMSFLDILKEEPSGPMLSGLIGDVLTGDAIKSLVSIHSSGKSCQLEDNWYCHWLAQEIRADVKIPLEDALQANADELQDQIASLPGAFYQKLLFLELWSRQRFFAIFQSTLLDYWRGVANPFMNRSYARFCLSIPRAALDSRRLLADVYRRYYGGLAVIPGTYAEDPFILTGQYALKRRVTKILPPALHMGALQGFGDIQLRMDVTSMQSTGREALWPIYDVWDRLAEWLDTSRLELDYETMMRSNKDIRPLRRLQSVQVLAYRLGGII